MGGEGVGQNAPPNAPNIAFHATSCQGSRQLLRRLCPNDFNKLAVFANLNTQGEGLFVQTFLD